MQRLYMSVITRIQWWLYEMIRIMDVRYYNGPLLLNIKLVAQDNEVDHNGILVHLPEMVQSGG